MRSETIFKPWWRKELPKKILAIRLQAFGDTLIAISYLNYLRQNLPSTTQIDFVTRKEFYNLPSNLNLFNKIYQLKGGNPLRYQMASALLLVPKLLIKNYDVVLDLQNNEVSNFLVNIINPSCYVYFDRYSAKHACLRNIETINKANLIPVREAYSFNYKNPNAGKEILMSHGWNLKERIILLNPAGAFSNRNWPIHNYIQLAKRMIEQIKEPIKFLILGTDKIISKAKEISNALNDKVMVIVNQTSQIEALSIMQSVSLCVTEDGGLMHMAYLSKINTIGILGSSRSDWLNPKLPHTYFFTSDDLECGNCMLDLCKFNTDYCMKRITVEQILVKALSFINLSKIG